MVMQTGTCYQNYVQIAAINKKKPYRHSTQSGCHSNKICLSFVDGWIFKRRDSEFEERERERESAESAFWEMRPFRSWRKGDQISQQSNAPRASTNIMQVHYNARETIRDGLMQDRNNGDTKLVRSRLRIFPPRSAAKAFQKSNIPLPSPPSLPPSHPYLSLPLTVADRFCRRCALRSGLSGSIFIIRFNGLEWYRYLSD
jgi:hypothetical protein